jgi:MYXO-CTERM domain-containing protein
MIACAGAPSVGEELGSVAHPVGIQKTYPRKIYVHMMPWFQVGGQHWSMKSRNAATGIASWYAPMIGEYSSNDGNVIEYQLLLMKYAGIDGILVDWPGLSGANDLPQNKANADAIIGRTAQFGLEFGVVYEDQYAASVDAAKNDMSYVRDNFFSKSNHIKINNVPGLLVFGPQKLTNPADWTNIISVFPTNPSFFTLWYNTNAGSNADGQFGWLAQNALKGVSDFDSGADGLNHGLTIPVLYPGFNPYYAQGGWPGPTYKISYTLKTDNTEGGDTFRSTFDLGKYAGDPLQIATWNDYGEGTMIEPTNQFQYQFLTTLQQAVGAIYTDAELKIVKMLYDQRKQFGASKQTALDQASAALANLDVATACGILGCTTPVHMGTGGSGGAGGSTGAGGSGSSGSAGAGGAAGRGSTAATTTTGTATGSGGGGATGSSGSSAATGGVTGASTTGSATVGAGGSGTSSTATATGSGGAAGSSGDEPRNDVGGTCQCNAMGATAKNPSAWLLAAGVFALASRRRRRLV